MNTTSIPSLNNKDNLQYFYRKVEHFNIRDLDHDNKDLSSYMHQYINKYNTNEPFIFCNLNNLNKRHDEWKQQFPNITPFYAVKCNSESNVLKRMYELGASFDCASKKEIEMVLETGCSPKRIIFANPCKQISHILYAKQNGVDLTVVDSIEEVLKLEKYYPETRFLVRLATPNKNCSINLSEKYGADIEEVDEILDICLEKKLKLIGLSFL